MTPLFLDTETFSEINLLKAGSSRYARDPSSEGLIITWGGATGPIQAHDLTTGPMPFDLAMAISDPSITKIAHNAMFDKEILEFTQNLETDWDSWMCSQALAYSVGFSKGLGDIQEALGMGEEIAKIKEGKKLIQRFSKPQPKGRNVRRWTRENDPEGWASFIEYAIRDTEAMRAVWMLLEPMGTMSVYEWKAWRDTQRMNERGMPVDVALIKQAIKLASKRKNELKHDMIEITGLENPNSGPQLLEWLKEQGVELPDMQANTVYNAIQNLPESPALDALKLKRVISQTAVSKWNAMEAMVCDDGTLKGQFQYRGASRTGRDASRGINLQNLRRPPKGDMDSLITYVYAGDNNLIRMFYGEPLDFLAGTVRGGITAPLGRMLVVSDLSSIESRVLGWVTGCERMNKIFAEGKDTYKDYATQLFRVPYDEVTKDQRNYSKPPVLGAGYMMGGKGLSRYAEGMGVQMEEQEAKGAVDVFRESYREIPAFWGWIMEALDYVVRTKHPISNHHLTLFMQGDYLMVRLPSGRDIAYYQPIWQMWNTPIGDRMSFTYMGINRFRPNPTWERIAAHAGGVTENIIQGIARDILIEWCHRIDDLMLIGRVHDEVIVEITATRAEDILTRVNEAIERGVDWAPGLLLAAEGMVTKHYDK